MHSYGPNSGISQGQVNVKRIQYSAQIQGRQKSYSSTRYAPDFKRE